MSPQLNIASAAFLIADPARTAMLSSLLDGHARSAGELASTAGVTAQTASSHLGKLLSGGFLTVKTQGRHRYYRLAGSHVALALENLASIGPLEPARRKAHNREAQNLEFARCCYDHLAGRVGVAVTHSLQQQGFLVAAPDNQFGVTSAGIEWFGRMGLDVAKLKPYQPGFARQCMDWTERKHHLAGPLGVQFMILLCSKGWLRRTESSRSIQVTSRGWSGFHEQLGFERRSIMSA